MSHWKTFKSDVLANTRIDLLTKALTDMGVELDTSIKSIRNAYGNDQVDMGFKKDGHTIALGLKEVEKDGKTFLELKGDFFATGLDEAAFIDRLSQAYQKERIIQTLTDNNYTIDSCKVNNKGEVEIEAYEYVYA
jgi:hypothetical protein